MSNQNLTSEKISQRFSNLFEMVNYLIGRVHSRVKRGQHAEDLNLALDVIEDVQEGYDLYEIQAENAPELEEEEEFEVEVESHEQDD